MGAVAEASSRFVQFDRLQHLLLRELFQWTGHGHELLNLLVAPISAVRASDVGRAPARVRPMLRQHTPAEVVALDLPHDGAQARHLQPKFKASYAGEQRADRERHRPPRLWECPLALLTSGNTIDLGRVASLWIRWSSAVASDTSSGSEANTGAAT